MRRVLLPCVLMLAGMVRGLSAQCEVTVLVAYYSQTGHTKTMAEGVARGARSVAEARVILAPIDSVTPAHILVADAVLVGSPVHMANVAPPVLSFINSWPFPDGMRDKIGAAFVAGGGISAGEEEVQLSILRAMLVAGMIVVGGSEWMGSFGASAITDEPPFADSSATGAVAQQFLDKAERLGRRTAEVTKAMRCGR